MGHGGERRAAEAGARAGATTGPAIAPSAPPPPPWPTRGTDTACAQVLDLMIVTQYFDMMKDVGAGTKSNAVFLDHSPGALNEIATTINKGFISSLPSATMAR